MKKVLTVLLIGILIGVFATITTLNITGMQPTGFIVVNKGSTTSVGEHRQSNPNYGAIKGTVAYTITDPDTGTVISSEPASSTTVYIVIPGKTINEWDRVVDAGETYSGELTSIDADGSSSVCSEASYTTAYKYYDENNNGVRDDRGNEFDVYTITTDSNGCFAMKLPTGNFDIYL